MEGKDKYKEKELDPFERLFLKLEIDSQERKAENKLLKETLETELGKLNKLHSETDARLTAELDEFKENVVKLVEDKDAKTAKLEKIEEKIKKIRDQ